MGQPPIRTFGRRCLGETQKALVQTKVPSAAESAASLLRASRERLRLWDVSEQQIRAIEEAGEPSLYQTVRSPASGVVLEKMIIAGQSVQAGMTLYRIADPGIFQLCDDVCGGLERRLRELDSVLEPPAPPRRSRRPSRAAA